MRLLAAMTLVIGCGGSPPPTMNATPSPSPSSAAPDAADATFDPAWLDPKDVVTAPRGPADGGDRDAIVRVIRAHRAELHACYANQPVALLDPGDSPPRFTIGPEGTVIEVAMGATGELERCLRGVFARMTFPKPAGGGSVVVSYPFR